MDQILVADKVKRIYRNGDEQLTVLDEISFAIGRGETVSIIGPSGSGKTTLLGLLAGLDRPSSGRIVLHGNDLSQLSEDQRAAVRNEHVGFIFQNFQLLPTLTALENVMVPMELSGARDIRKRALMLLEQTGLKERVHHYPSQLSGGEQQRVSLARAFANQPAILFADEPTGNLDAETSERITQLIFDLNKQAGTTLVLVTHDPELALMTERTLRMRGGKLIEDRMNRPAPTNIQA